MKRIIIALIIACSVVPVPVVAGNSKGPVSLFVTVLTGAAAIGAAKNADAANTLYHKKETLAEKLKAQGIDPENRAIYAAYLQLDKNASAIYWERWIGWPNVVLEVEIAGQGSFLIPRIDMEWQGQPILENLIGEYPSLHRAKAGAGLHPHLADGIIACRHACGIDAEGCRSAFLR